MRQGIRYQCRRDLRRMREFFEMTREEVAEKVGYEVRTIVRIEEENATTTEETAIKLAELYELDYVDNFFIVEKRLLDVLRKNKKRLMVVRNRQDIMDTRYYCLYIRKTNFFQDCVLGKGIWVREYNRNKEVRKLLSFSRENIIEHFSSVPICVTSEEWEAWYMGTTVGKLYKIIVSEECMKSCLSECLKETIVRKDELYWLDGFTDIMFWGCKQNRIPRKCK